jgi:hypothetical protein
VAVAVSSGSGSGSGSEQWQSGSVAGRCCSGSGGQQWSGAVAEWQDDVSVVDSGIGIGNGVRAAVVE